MEIESRSAKRMIRAMYVGHDEHDRRTWLLDCAGKFFIAHEEDDAESYEVERGAWMPMPAGIFDILISELLAHPELARAKYDKPLE